MKKIVNYILLSALMITFLPYSALAQTTDVGVKITGSASIDVVTTISADITVDLSTGKTSPTYMELQNNSVVPVSAKITNISTTSEGAPSTFVKAVEKTWDNLSKADTNTYVNFNVLKEGQDVTAQDILPNTEIDLGTLPASVNGFGADYSDNTLEEINCVVNNGRGSWIKYYEINANFGHNWNDGDKNFTYKIETIYSQSDTEASSTFKSINGIDGVSATFSLIGATDSSKDYISLVFKTNKELEEFNNQINTIKVFVNDEKATAQLSAKDVSESYRDSASDNSIKFYEILFTIPKLEREETNTIYYLTTNVYISKDTQQTNITFIDKVRTVD